MIFSDHFKHSLKVIGVLILLLSGLFVYLKSKIKEIVLPSNHTESTAKLQDYGHGFIVTHKNGKTTIKPKEYGMPFDVGVSGAIGYQETELYLTTEIFYFRRFELLGGAGISYPIIHPRIMLALGYRLPWKRFDNLSLFVGHNTQSIIFGVYGRFGSN